MTLLTGVGLMVMGTVVAAVGALYLKKGAAVFSLKTVHKNYALMAGVFGYGLSMLLAIPALKFGHLNILFPITSLSYVWSLLLSKVVLDEAITSRRVIGVLLVVCGVALTLLQ